MTLTFRIFQLKPTLINEYTGIKLVQLIMEIGLVDFDMGLVSNYGAKDQNI